MRVDLESYEANYLLYEQFTDELEKLGEQEWILFRNRTYLFDEFLTQWAEKLKSAPVTPVTVRLRKDIEGMHEFSANLKYCRGEALGSDHWLELFRMLKLPRGMTLERLKFSDLVRVQASIMAQIEQLKALNHRAQGEVTIREAIQVGQIYSEAIYGVNWAG
jgi:dynein heavy chain 2